MNYKKFLMAKEDTKGKSFTMQEALTQKEKWLCYWMLQRSDIPFEMFLALEDHIESLEE